MRCGTKSVFSAWAAKLRWLANPSPRRGKVHTVSSVLAASMPKSVPAATRPSQVSEVQDHQVNNIPGSVLAWDYLLFIISHFLSLILVCLDYLSVKCQNDYLHQTGAGSQVTQVSGSDPFCVVCMFEYILSLCCVVSSYCLKKGFHNKSHAS